MIDANPYDGQGQLVVDVNISALTAANCDILPESIQFETRVFNAQSQLVAIDVVEICYMTEFEYFHVFNLPDGEYLIELESSFIDVASHWENQITTYGEVVNRVAVSIVPPPGD